MVTYDLFPDGLEVMGANGCGGLNLGRGFVDRQAAYQRTKK